MLHSNTCITLVWSFFSVYMDLDQPLIAHGHICSKLCLLVEDNRYSCLRGCIGAIDGTLIPVNLKPHVTNQDGWRCRKGYYAQNLFICAAHDKTISYFSAMHEGSVNDSTIVDLTKFESLIPG